MSENKKEENMAEEIKVKENQTEKAKDEKDQPEEVKVGENKDQKNQLEGGKTEKSKKKKGRSKSAKARGNKNNKFKAEEDKVEVDKVTTDKTTNDETKTDKEIDKAEEAATIADKATNDKAETNKEINKTEETTNDETETGKETDNAEETPKKNRKKWVIPLVLSLICIFVLLGGAYIGLDLHYQSHFLPSTEINGTDCSGMTALEAAALLDEQIQGYSLVITGRDYSTGKSGAVLGTISPQDIQLTFEDMLGAAEEIMAEQELLPWIMSFGNLQSVYSLVQDVVFDDAMLESTVKAWAACQSSNMVKARDAYISEYSEELQGYEVIPETSGTEFDVKQVVSLAADAVLMQETSLDLEALDLYSEASIRQDDSRLTKPVETANHWLGTNITYDWNGSEVILDASTICDWVTIEDGEAILDEEAVNDFVKTQSRSYDTYGQGRNFVTALGVEMYLSNFSYGWMTDTAAETEALMQLIQEGSTESREPIYATRGMVKGTSDIGDSYVEADLTNQHLYLYVNGGVVLETDFVSGRMSGIYPTPAGIFGITYKTRNAILRGPGYATPVSYWMPFYYDFGLHDAGWRAAFGGDIYIENGSHGCINLPPDMARQIYDYVSTGFPVICYYYPEPVAPPEPDSAEGEAVAGEPAE